MKSNESAELFDFLDDALLRLNKLGCPITAKNARDELAQLRADNEAQARTIEAQAENIESIEEQYDQRIAQLEAQISAQESEKESLRHRCVELDAMMDRYTTRIAAQQTAIAQARSWLARLLVSVYPDINPFDDLIGIVSQIDNGFAVPLLAARDAPPADQAAPQNYMLDAMKGSFDTNIHSWLFFPTAPKDDQDKP